MEKLFKEGTSPSMQAGSQAGLREAPADQLAQALGTGGCVCPSSRAQGGRAEMAPH